MNPHNNQQSYENSTLQSKKKYEKEIIDEAGKSIEAYLGSNYLYQDFYSPFENFFGNNKNVRKFTVNFGIKFKLIDRKINGKKVFSKTILKKANKKKVNIIYNVFFPENIALMNKVFLAKKLSIYVNQLMHK